MLTWLFLVLGLLDPITVSVEPRVCLSPCEAVVRVTVRRDIGNASVETNVDGPSYGADELQPVPVEGGQFNLSLHRLPEGEYRVLAVLFRTVDGRIATTRVRTTLEVK